jgi:hypothetical protein
MADFNSSKVDGDSVDASEWNQLASIDNFITTSGQTPSTSNLNQMGIGAARYSSGGQFFTDSGTANAYVLTSISPFKSPVSSGTGEGYFIGMTIRFRAGNTNTGASTVNVNSAGVKNLKKEDGTTDLDVGDISTTRDSIFRYNGTSFVQVLQINPLFSNKNAIINGDFNIWQRGTSFASVADATYNADRFYYNKSGAMVHDVSRSTDVPTFAQANRGFNYSTLVDCQTVDAAIGATDLSLIGTAIEGFNFLPLAQKPMTLSFWVKATKIGIYCVALTNNADRSYVAEYTINVADTWEYKTITIAASPSAGTWNYTNGVGLRVNFALAIGANSQTTKDAWQTGLFYGTSNQVNACDNIANNFRITGIQLEAGSVATPFENRTIQQELELCQRYYEKSYNITDAPETITGNGQFIYDNIASTIGYVNIRYKTTKRTASTITISNPVAGGASARNYTASTNIAYTTAESSESGFSGYPAATAGTNRALGIHWAANSEL